MASPSPDPHAGGRLRHLARLARGERRILSVVRDALTTLGGYALSALRESGMDPAVLETTVAPWRDALTNEVTPAIADVFNEAWDAVAGGVIDPGPYSIRHIESVWNRLSGTSDDVFDTIRGLLAAGHQEGLSIQQLTTQIEGLLTGADSWEGRARTIARTEAIAANNAGAAGSARATAEYLGLSPDQVTQSWLATGDGRTRASHMEADGQTVTGLDTPFVVGGYELAYPGDPDGPPEETVNCRCTTLYEYPEVDAIAASANQEATMISTPLKQQQALLAALEDDEPTGVVIVALPADNDPVHSIGDEQKHATLLFFGDAPADVALLQQVTATVAAANAPVMVDVQGVESLGPDGARVWMLDAADLTSIRDALIGTDSEVQTMLDAVEQFPDFAPHTTIGYPDDVVPVDAAPSEDVTVEGELDPEVETAAAAVSRITFDRLAVWAGSEQTEYALTASDTTDEEPPVAESTTASGTTRLLTRRTASTEAALRTSIDRLVDAGFGSREAVARAMGRALNEPIHAIGRLSTSGPLTAAAGDPAPAVLDTEGLEVMEVGDPAPALGEVPVEDRPNPDRFHGICTVEDEQTGDGRVFGPGSIYWDEAGLPMPLGWQVADAPGHDGSVVCGRIDSFERVGNAITYTGTWDLDGAGWETRRLVDGQFLRGISVDTDDVDVVLVTPEGEPLDMFDMMMEGGELPVALIQRGRLRSAALCRVPAFAPSGTSGAYIANGLPEDLVAAVADPAIPTDETAPPADEVVVEALVAAAVHAGNPATSRPPVEVFGDPGLERPTPITITDDGRVFGHLASWGTCHIGVQGSCVTPPKSMTGYAHFLHGETLTASGAIPTGVLTMDTGHAGPSLKAHSAVSHYDNTGTAFARVAVGEDSIGIWVAGVLRPGVTDAQIETIRAAGALSGDWRRIGGNLELVAALAVNTPGFPLPRLALAASGSQQISLVAAGIVTPAVEAVARGQEGLLTYTQVRDVVRQELAADRRRGRVETAAARLRAHKVASAVARLERF